MPPVQTLESNVKAHTGIHHVSSLTGCNKKHNVPSNSPNHEGAGRVSSSAHNYNGLSVNDTPSWDNHVHLTSTPHNIETQTPILVFEEQHVQTLPSKAFDKPRKSHKTQTVITHKEDACIQTIKQKQKHEVVQTSLLTRNVQSNTESVGQVDRSAETVSCNTENRHVQTFLKSKSTGTQYKKQNYQDNPPKKTCSDIVACESESSSASMVSPQQAAIEADYSEKLLLIMDKMKMIDKIDETATLCANL